MTGESSPAIHIHQQFGDLDTRQQHSGLVDQLLCSFGDDGIQRGDFQSGIGDDGIGKFIGQCQAIVRGQLLLELLLPIMQVLAAIRIDGDRQCLCLFERLEFHG